MLNLEKNHSQENVVQTTISAGTLLGKRLNGIDIYKGVSYAQPPVNDLRFEKPQPVIPWHGTREAFSPGASAPQLSASYPRLDMPPIVGNGWQKGSDYLTLNIWAPTNAVNCPVMVWIHGGAFAIGNKDAAVYDGSEFARSGVICVAINYRLGIEGFIPIPGAPTNLGLRDMIAALQWVQENVGYFGGDVKNVTIFGESAGGISISTLVASPLTAGLFKRAIIQSGNGSLVLPLAIAQRTVDKIAELLHIPPNVQAFRQKTYEECLAVQAKVTKMGAVNLNDANGFNPLVGMSSLAPVYGDDVLPEHPLKLLAKGAGKSVEMLIGTNAEELSFWFAPIYFDILLPKFVARWLLKHVIPDASGILEVYGSNDRHQHGGKVLERVLTDLAFRWPARQYAAAHQGQTHVFEFDWSSNACNGKLGACHGVDMPFVFKTLSVASGPRGMAGMNPPQELADRIHGIWVRYATDGFLPWQPFNTHERQVHQLWQDKTIFEEVMPAAKFIPEL